jgi:hypothetical protein
MRAKSPEAGLLYVYSGQHVAGTVERVAANRWRASTRHALLGADYHNREAALAALHAALDRHSRNRGVPTTTNLSLSEEKQP